MNGAVIFETTHGEISFRPKYEQVLVRGGAFRCWGIVCSRPKAACRKLLSSGCFVKQFPWGCWLIRGKPPGSCQGSSELRFRLLTPVPPDPAQKTHNSLTGLGGFANFPALLLRSVAKKARCVFLWERGADPEGSVLHETVKEKLKIDPDYNRRLAAEISVESKTHAAFLTMIRFQQENARAVGQAFCGGTAAL